MQRAPRSIDASIFQAEVVWRGFWQGSIIFLSVLAIYWFAIQHGISTDETRAITFAAIVVGNLGFIFLNRSLSGNLQHALRAPNPIIWWVCGLTCLAMTLILFIPYLRQLFYFGNPEPLHLLLSIIAAAASVSLVALSQTFLFRRLYKKPI